MDNGNPLPKTENRTSINDSHQPSAISHFVMSTKPPSGTRDFLPDDIRRREYVVGVIRDVYERYGFEPLETPAFENIETLLGKYGEEGNKLIFKILRRGEHEATGEADLALRYDLTVPLARVVAEYHDKLPKFFKRYQIQPVWRADRPARGRFREFYQCDIDALGTTSLLVELEVLSAVSEALVRLHFETFDVRLNHRELLVALLGATGVPPAVHDEALVAIDKLDKIGVDGVRSELTQRGIAESAAVECLELFRAEFPAALRRRLAGGLSYYTGAIMEIAVPDLAGSLGGGGRYDKLVGMFLGRDVPACGFSLCLERILVVMAERNMFPAQIARGSVEVMVTIWSHATRGDSLAMADALRGAGLRADVYPEADKLGKQFKYASARHVPFVAILGDDERGRGEVALKNMGTGEQTSVRRGEAAAFIREKLTS